MIINVYPGSSGYIFSGCAVIDSNNTSGFGALDLTLVVDHSSIELFDDNSLTVMTQLFLFNELFSAISIQTPTSFSINSIKLTQLKSINASPIPGREGR